MPEDIYTATGYDGDEFNQENDEPNEDTGTKQNPVRYLRAMSLQLMRTLQMLPLMNTTTIQQPQNLVIIKMQTQTTMKMIPHTMILDCHRD
eukprot:14086214-Ditylum_brightwellii.AAC.1